MARHLDAGGERLEGHPTLDEAGNVDVAAVGALQQVATPEERVGVEVGDKDRAVELAGPGRRLVGRRAVGQVLADLGARDEGAAGSPDAGSKRGAGHETEGRAALHGPSPSGRRSTSSSSSISPVGSNPSRR